MTLVQKKLFYIITQKIHILTMSSFPSLSPLDAHLNKDLLLWIQHADVYGKEFFYHVIFDGSVYGTPPEMPVTSENAVTIDRLQRAVGRDLAVVNYIFEHIQ